MYPKQIMFKTTMLRAFILVIVGNASSTSNEFQLDLPGFQFDETTKQSFFNSTHLVIASQSRTIDQYYQLSLKLINIHDKSIVKETLIGDPFSDFYYPQILTVNNCIYLAYINQEQSIIKAKISKFDQNLVEKEGELILGEGLQSAKFDNKIQYLQLSQFNQNSIAILWYSRGRDATQKQWNFRQLDIKENSLSEITILPNSKLISVAQNNYGTTIFAQYNETNCLITFSKLSKTLTTNFVKINQCLNYLKVFSLLNNNFLVLSQSYESVLRFYNHQFEPLIQPINYSWFYYYSGDTQLFDYTLYQIQNQDLKITSLDISDPFQQIPWRQQERYIYFWKNFITVSLQADRIDGFLYIRWLYKINYYDQKAELAILQVDMSTLIDECISNCMNCNPRLICQSCQTGYILKENKCEAICPANCQFCSSPLYCDQCKDGFQYTSNNQCIKPIDDDIDLRISDEEAFKNKPKILTVDNEVILIYGVYFSTNSYLKIRKLNSLGQEITQTKLIDEKLEDYDLTQGSDDSTFLLLVKWSQNQISYIVNYVIDMNDLSIISEDIFRNNIIPQMQGDQIKVVRFQNKCIYYFYITFDQNTYYLNYVKKNLNDDQEFSYSTYLSQFDNIQLQTFVSDTLYIRIRSLESETIYYLYENYLYSLGQQNSRFLSTFYLDFQTFSYTDYDKYAKRLFLNVTNNKTQISLTSRNPREHSINKIGERDLLVVWLGLTNIEQTQFEQVYLQRVSLDTLQINNLKQNLCPKNCIECDQQGYCSLCANENFDLLNGKCQLICPQNCNKCEKEFECQSCDQSFILDNNLNCVLGEEQYLYKIENVHLMYVSGTEGSSLQSVYYLLMNEKYEVIYEELDRKGDPLSGQIRISIDDDKVLQKQLKVIKRNQYVYIGYVRQIQSYMQQVFVVLNKNYQIYSRSYMDITEESDFAIKQDLEIYWITQVQQNNKKYIKITDWKISGNILIYQQEFFSEGIDVGDEYRDVRFANIDDSIKFTILVNIVKDQIATNQYFILDSKLNQRTQFLQHANAKYYFNLNHLWFVVYDVVNNMINLKFYNNLEELQYEYQIQSENQIVKHKLYTNDFHAYLIYIEQGSLQQIQIIQYSVNGEYEQKIQVQPNEIEINGLSVAINNEFILLAWSSAYNKSVYQVLLTKELQIVPIDKEVCIQNCNICQSDNSCSECFLGYEFDDIQCNPICVDNCQSCSKPYTCDICFEGFINIGQQCQDVSKLQIEQSICSENCLGVASMTTYNYNGLLLTYVNYEASTYNILAQTHNSYYYQYEMQVSTKQILITQSTQIQYHEIYSFSQGTEFALIWLSGNCEVQCRLMLQFFKNDFSTSTNAIELRIMAVNIQNFNLQISNLNYDFVFLWTEQDNNLVSQTYVCQYNQQTGSLVLSNINENADDISVMPNLVLQEKHKVLYVKNFNTINILTLDTNTYQQLYQTKNTISSLSIVNALYSQGYYWKRILVGWIEISGDNYNLHLKLFDWDYNCILSDLMFQTQNRIISNLQMKSVDQGDIFIIGYIEQETETIQRIKTYVTNFHNIMYQIYNVNDLRSQNILSTLVQTQPYKIFISSAYGSYQIIFRGISDNKEQIFVSKDLSGYKYLPSCDTNCFYCDSDMVCQLCKQDYELKDKLCLKKLPNYCDLGQNGICQQCSNGYNLDGNQCILSDPQYDQIKMNTYRLSSKQRISNFQNGDYIVVWFRKYYESQGTGIFMSLFNSHGDKIKDEIRITLGSAGIQIFPDVQVLSNDEFIVVWIDGDLNINANIKKQRFNKQFIRIGEEITIKKSIKLNNFKQYDTPLVIQKIINGYLILWTQSIEQKDKLFVIFYNSQDEVQSEYELSQDYQIKISEPSISSNQQIIVILWESYSGIISSTFSLNNILINTKIISKNGQSPSISVLNNGNFITAWREQIKLKNLYQTYKILHTQYLQDLSSYLYSYTFGENECNQNNPDIISIDNGYAIIFENIYFSNTDIRNIKLQIFNLGGQSITNLITVTNLKNIYPHHPQLNILPQNEFIASWSSSSLNSITDDIYMKRYNNQGQQLLLSTIICVNNCQACTVNDICQICLDGYILIQQQCLQVITNCNAYQQDAAELLCTQCDAEYKLVNNKCINLINNELLVEFVNNISLSYRQLIFSNDNILYLWREGVSIFFQRFDKYGNALTMPKSWESSFSKFRSFDAVVIDDEFFMVSFLGDSYIGLYIFNQNGYFVTGNTIYRQYSQGLSPSLSKFAGQIKQTEQYRYSVLDFIDSVSQYIQYHMTQVSITFSENYPQIFIENSRLINLVQYPQDIQLDKELKILLPIQSQNSRYGYQYEIYDYQGNIQQIFKIPLNERRIEFRIAELNETSFIEFWSELEFSTYEIFYQIKGYDHTNVTERVQIQSNSIYKIDLQIILKRNTIILVWRESNEALDINTFYSVLVVSSETFEGVKISLNQPVDPSAEKLKVSQLSNQDLIFSFVTQVEGQNVLTAIKVSPDGKPVKFSELRCDSGCQECTIRGCLKCMNQYLLQEGKCSLINVSCLNYDIYCSKCLSGYYKTKYNTCELISQFLETKIKEFTTPYMKQGFYQDGRSIIIENYQSSQLKLTFYGADGSISQEGIVIYQVSLDIEYIREYSLLITKNNVLTVIVQINQNCWQCNNKFNVLQFDEQINQVGTQITIYDVKQDYLESKFKITELQNNQIGIAIQKFDQIYFAVYNNDLISFIGNNFVKAANNIYDFDITSTLENIILAYSFQEEQASTIVKVYDNKINFIKDISISDSQPIKLISNSLGQIIIASKNQINIIEKYKIIYSVEHIDLQPIQISTNTLNQIVVLYLKNNQLILAFYDEQGQYLYEQQINMLGNPISPYNLHNLSNNDFIIQFQLDITPYYYYSQNYAIYISRFDQFGKSKTIGDVVCPKNCDICINSTSCQICSNAYKRNELTLLCEKICTIENCLSCENSDCDICQEGFSLNTTGQCTLIIYQPLPNLSQEIDQCTEPIEIRNIKLKDNEFAFAYICLNTIQIKKFNILNELLLEYSTIFQSSYSIFEALQVNNVVYIVVVFNDSPNQVTIYKLDINFTQLNVVAQITNVNQITKLFFASTGTQYMLIISSNKFYTFDDTQQICENSSYFIYDQKYGDKKLNEKKDFVIPYTVNECNRNIVKQIGSMNVFYVIINSQYDVQVAQLNSQGIIGNKILPIQPVSDIYFDITQSRIVLLSKSIGFDNWELSIWDSALVSFYFRDQYFLQGSYQFSIVATEMNILIAWSSIGQIEYKLLSASGNLQNHKIIQNNGKSNKPQLIKLQSNSIGISWTDLNTQNQYQFQFGIIDQSGEFTDMTIVCPNNCNSCSSSTVCTQCNDQFMLINGACVKQCSPLCYSCDQNSGLCLRCANNYMPSAETCIINEIQQSAIKINDYSELSQTQADAVTLSDGSLITVWSSMGEDGDSWGVYAQLQDSQGKKVGDNIKINEQTEGSQHSPQIIRLIDDTVLIIFIDGDPISKASIKGIRYSNQLVKLGNEQLFSTFTFSQFQIQWSNIVQIESLRSGGFVIVFVSDYYDYQDYQQFVTITFYDTFYNIIKQNSIVDQIGYDFKIASTGYNFALLLFQYDQMIGFFVNAKLYSLDGQLIQDTPVVGFNTYDFYTSRLIGDNQFYAIVISNQGRLVQFQLFDQQFTQQGQQITIEQDVSNLNSDFQITISALSNGYFVFVCHPNYQGQPFYNQYFVDLNWQVTFIKKITLVMQRNIICLESVNHQYFIIWVSDVEDLLDISNVYVQRFSQTGELMKIDEIACSSNCEKCEIMATCSNCVDNYKLIGSYCEPICESNCSSCTTPNVCDICDNGYYLPIAGKCSPIPITYYEPEALFTYSINSQIFDSNKLSPDTFVVYSQEYSWVEKKVIYLMKLIQNKQVIKTISPQNQNIPIKFAQVFAYYLDDQFILVFYLSDCIMVKRFDSQSFLILDQQIPWPTNIGQYVDYNSLLQPLENNQYVLIYFYINKAADYSANDKNTIYKAYFDQQLNLISAPDQIFSSAFLYLQQRTKYSLKIQSNSGNEILLVVTKDNIQQTNCQSTQFGGPYCLIYQISNGNYVQIIEPYYDINNYNYRYYFNGQLKIYYRILDSNYQALTTEEKVIQNNYIRQKFITIYTFDDSFTIVIQQFNQLYQQISQLVGQRFDNSGIKIGDYYLINQFKQFSIVQTFAYENGFLIFWSERDNQSQQNIVKAKQFDQNGVESSWSNNAKCISNCEKCINPYYCQTCSINYKSDTNYQCQAICAENCDQCNTPQQCLQCSTGYLNIDNQCNKIQCINNCALCNLEGSCQNCNTNYSFNSEKTQCQPICASNCTSCTNPLECDTCSTGFTITSEKKCQQDYVNVITQVETTVGTPMIATFPNGDYIELFFQSGDNAGVYFQLYNKDGVKQGNPTKVGGISRRRLLTSTIQQFAADLAINANQFAILWLDASSDNTLAKIQKFDQQGTALGDIIELGTYPQTDLTNIKLPCQISTTSNNNFIVSYYAQSDNEYSLFVETFDSQLAKKGLVKEIKKVNALSAPSIAVDENGIISLTYQSEGYLFVQQLTEDGDTIDQPKAISDTNSLIVRTTNLKNGFIVFLWENKNIQSSIQQFNLNYQLISKDLKTKSQIFTVGTIQKASLDPDIQSFNEGFIVVWKITDNTYKTSGLQFQIFDQLGQQSTKAIDVQIEGLYPDNPRIQIINDSQIMITCTAKTIDTDGTILGDSIYMQKYNQNGIIEQNQKSLDLCSYQCQNCQSPLICLKCQSGYYLNSNNQCQIDCGLFCESCVTPLICSTCKNGYKLKDNSICEETECQQGYIRNPITKLCESQECPDNCNKCTSDQCMECKENYILSMNNSCKQLMKASSEMGENTMYTIIIIVLASALFGTALCAYAQYTQKKKLINTRYNQVHPNSFAQESCNQTQVIMRD